MKKRMINSQISNYKTYLMYKRQMKTLAENVFKFNNLPEYIDVAYLNKTLHYIVYMQLFLLNVGTICISKFSISE